MKVVKIGSNQFNMWRIQIIEDAFFLFIDVDISYYLQPKSDDGSYSGNLSFTKGLRDFQIDDDFQLEPKKKYCVAFFKLNLIIIKIAI